MTQTTPETARALLDRHGLSEDVIDGALCLHAQELAALQRNDAQARHDRSYSDNRVFELKGARTAADLIDPTKGAAVSAVMGPPADRADLRARISEGLRNARRNGLGGMTEAEAVAHMAAAILAVLPEPADRAAGLSDVERQFLTCALDLAADQMASRGDEFGAEDQAAMETLRRLAVEAQSCRWEHPHPGYQCEPRTAVEAHDTGTQQQDAPASRLSGQHADALWDAIAPPGPDRPSYPVQHERVCRVVADIVDEVTAGAGLQQPHTEAPTTDRPAVLREIATTLDQLAETDVIRKRRSLATARRLLAIELRRMADDVPAPVAQQPAAEVPKLPPMDPVHILGIGAEQQAAAADGEETEARRG